MRGRAGKILIVLIAVVWAVGLRAAIRWHGWPWKPAARDDTEDDAKKGAELAALLPPISTPTWTLTAADAARLDARWVIGLVRAKRTRELARALEAAEDHFERDRAKEAWVESLFGGLSFAAGPDLPVMDDWVRTEPESFTGYVARAAARLNIARRATPVACSPDGRRTPSAETTKIISLAREDLDVAIARRPKLVVAHTLLLRSFVEEGVPAPRDAFDRAAAVCPACSGPRIQYLLGLRPAWGGSREAMNAFAEESQVFVRENPRLRALLGYVDWLDCDRALDAEKLADARSACDRALSTYPAVPFFRTQALAAYYADEIEKAVNGFSAILTQDPYDVDALVGRARAYGKLEEWKKASADARSALELEPTYERARTFYGWLYEQVDRETKNASRTGELSDMLDAYDSAASVFPEERRFRDGRAAIAKRGGPTLADRTAR